MDFDFQAKRRRLAENEVPPANTGFNPNFMNYYPPYDQNGPMTEQYTTSPVQPMHHIPNYYPSYEPHQMTTHQNGPMPEQYPMPVQSMHINYMYNHVDSGVPASYGVPTPYFNSGNTATNTSNSSTNVTGNMVSNVPPHISSPHPVNTTTTTTHHHHQSPPINTHNICKEFIYNPENPDVAEEYLSLERQLCRELSKLTFPPPVTHVYNPIDYASETHSHYVKKYLTSRKTVLFLGMNPGPYGMAQNGVPFGEGNFVRDWLKIQGKVRKPANEHPSRPIQGLECTRSEVSGARFWGYIKRLSGEPEVFFRYCFVHNYCPMSFMAKSGKNITPPDLPVIIRRPLQEVSDAALCQVVRLLGVSIVVGVGKYVQEKASLALRNGGVEGIRVEAIMHPSPINPNANKGWEDTVTKQLSDMQVLQYLFKKETQGSSSAEDSSQDGDYSKLHDDGSYKDSSSSQYDTESCQGTPSTVHDPTEKC